MFTYKIINDEVLAHTHTQNKIFNLLYSYNLICIKLYFNKKENEN